MCTSAEQLALTVLQDTVESKRYQGKPNRQCLDDIKQWTGKATEKYGKGQTRDIARENGHQLLSPARTVNQGMTG